MPDLSLPRLAIFGATGAVGSLVCKLLAEREFPFQSIRFFGAPKTGTTQSDNRQIEFAGRSYPVEPLLRERIANIDLAIASTPDEVAREVAPWVVAQGGIMIDESAAHRMMENVPLVIPEINPEAAFDHKGIVANPNCSTIIAITPLWPIHKVNPVKRLVAATYQAASGAGAAAMEELEQATRAFLSGEPFEQKIIPHPYPFNVFSHNSNVDPETGYNEEELKMVKETKKIFADPDIRVTATCVRVPVLRAHSEALDIECENPITPQDVREILAGAPGVRIVDDRAENYFPMPKDASGQDDILVGRIRQDISDPSGRSIAMFVAGDQLLKGAALNAVQIGEVLVRAAK